MNRAHKLSTIIILVYSAILLALGIILTIFGHYILSTFVKYIFAEMVDINLWRLNWYILGFFNLSEGALGVYFGVLIKREKEGIERLWLLLITWQFTTCFLPIGPYIIGAPDLISITIVGCICALSWVVFFPSKLRTFSLTNKNLVFELLLFFTIASQLFAITYINSKEDPSLQAFSNFTEQEFENKIGDELLGNAMRNKVMTDMYGRHHEKYFAFYDYYEQKDIEKLKESGDFLLDNGYENDRLILGVLATESYARGELQEAANLLKLAIKGGYHTELAKPSGDGIYFEEAQLHYTLYLIYEELGNKNESERELSLSHNLFKKFYGTKYNEELLRKITDMTEEGLMYFISEGK